MAAVQRKLVHKQFNSPMDLYSNENIRETVNRELKAVGSMRIEVEEQHIPKALNLANSAVLRALEEEEHEQQCGYKRVAWPPIVEDKIPREFTPQPQSQFQPQQYNQQTQQIPASAGANQSSHVNQSRHLGSSHHRHDHHNQHDHLDSHIHGRIDSEGHEQHFRAVAVSANDETHYMQSQYKSPICNQHNTITQSEVATWPPGLTDPSLSSSNPISHHLHYQSNSISLPQRRQDSVESSIDSGSHQQYQAHRAPSAPVGYQQHHHQQQQPPPQYFGSHSLASQQPQQQQQQSSSHPTLVDGVKQSQPVGYYQIPQQQQQYQQQSPNQLLQQDYYQQPQYRQSEPPEKQYNYYSQPQDQTSSPQHQQQQQQQLAGGHPQQQFRGESPGVITLRKEVPLTQQPSPVYSSQPATASFRGGSNMRGDLKWPPPEYKEQAAVDNDDRVKLAKGPVCRPRRIKKDYTQFFAKNALNSYYPSYRVPPGTQHMIN